MQGKWNQMHEAAKSYGEIPTPGLLWPPESAVEYPVGAKDTFSANFRRLLDAKFGGNAAEFARTTGLDPSKVSRWARGATFPEASQLDRIATAFDVTLPELFSDAEEFDPELERVNDAIDKAVKELKRLATKSRSKPKTSR